MPEVPGPSVVIILTSSEAILVAGRMLKDCRDSSYLLIRHVSKSVIQRVRSHCC